MPFQVPPTALTAQHRPHTRVLILELRHAPPLHAGDIGFFAFLIAVPTVAAYGLVQIALRRTESSLVAAYIYLQPLLAAVGAWFLLDEQPTLRTGVCGALVLFGVWLAAKRTQQSLRGG